MGGLVDFYVMTCVTCACLSSHAVKLVGWGSENGVPFWRIANSWNTDWVSETFYRLA